MDYSQLPHDPEHPAGESPWNTSPHAPRTGFPVAQSGDSEPSTPFLHSQTDTGSALPTPSEGDMAGQQEQRLSQARTENGDSGPAAHQSQRQPPHDAAEVYDRYKPIGPHDVGSPARPSSSGRQPQSRQTTNAQPTTPRTPGHYKLQAKITGLERTGRKDPVLRFDVYTNLPGFRTTQFRDVRRTHSEFTKLAQHLISSNPEAFVPAVPPSVTSAGAGTDEDEARVKGSMQRWLNTVCGNEILIRDEEMRFFVESDFGYSPVVRMKQPATGVRRKMIKQFAPPPDETPELFEARPIVKKFYLGTMETGQKVDKVVRARRALGLAEADLGVKVSHMHVQEEHAGLGNAYKKLGRTVQTAGDAHAAQGTAEATTFADPLNYHSADAFIVKETLTNRHILLRDLLAAQSTTRSKLSACDRLRASTSVRRDKVDEAMAALDEARSHEQHLKQKTQRVTASLLLAKRKWFTRTAEDLRGAIREYVLRQIDSERRALALLESARPDVRAIDASGGLSRLGRESHPAARRASLAASQGPKGDAWSGVQRRGAALNRSLTGSFAGVPPVEEDVAEGEGDENASPRARRGSGHTDDDDDDRVDARNAASRLATSTF